MRYKYRIYCLQNLISREGHGKIAGIQTVSEWTEKNIRHKDKITIRHG